MDHRRHDHIVKSLLGHRIRQLGTDKCVYLLGSADLVLVAKDYQNVGVRESTFLELDHVEVSHGNAQHVPLGEISHELLEFKLEYSRGEIGTVFCPFIRR